LSERLRLARAPPDILNRHISRQAAKDDLGSGIVFALIALVLGDSAKNNDFVTEVAKMASVIIDPDTLQLPALQPAARHRP
jgi:hypothetical protein